MNYLVKEMYKLVKGKSIAESPITHAAAGVQDESHSTFAGFSGNLLHKKSENSKWIIDSGATAHMSSKLSIFCNIKLARSQHTVVLPDGSKQNVDCVGEVRLTEKDVLHLNNFQFDLLSVGKLLDDLKVSVQLWPDYCVLQDQATGKTMEMAWKSNGLYRLNDASYYLQYLQKMNFYLSSNVNKESCIWHRRLGHTTNETLSHII